MFWVIIILAIGGFIFWKFNKDSKEVEIRNQSFGGMKKMFPEFVDFFELNDFELVENSGTKLIYKKPVSENPSINNFVFLGIESKFSNIAFGYVINGNSEKIESLNVKFPSNYRSEEVDMIIKRILGDLEFKGGI